MRFSTGGVVTEEERLREQWEEIMSTPLDVMFRAVLREEPEGREGASVPGDAAPAADSETVRLHSLQIAENQRELESLSTIMLGKNGEGGFVRELKHDMKELLTEVKELRRIGEEESRARVIEGARVEAKFTKQETDINNLADMARGARDAVSSLIADRKELNKIILKQLLTIGGPFLLLTIGAFIALAKMITASGAVG